MPITPATWPGNPPPGGEPKHNRRFWLQLGTRTIPLEVGEALVGRSPVCQVAVDDMLVSRRHARLLVSKDAVFVEDFASTNGVLVNESLISGATRLEEGDRIIFGTQELVLRSAPADEEESPKTTPAIISSGRRPIAPVPVRSTAPPPSSDDAPVHTEKADGLGTMARLADRMMSMGRHDAAARLLGDHLRGILAAVKQGRSVPFDVLDTVGAYGMKLTDVTRDPTWANIALEVHLSCRRPLPEKAVALLESLAPKLTLDRQTLLSYKAVLRDVAPIFGKEEQALIDRISKVPSR